LILVNISFLHVLRAGQKSIIWAGKSNLSYFLRFCSVSKKKKQQQKTIISGVKSHTVVVAWIHGYTCTIAYYYT
jgi:hypothetical protein